jgi:heterodisulfide reductase subunit D
MYSHDKCFTFSGGGFMYLAKGLIENRLAFDSTVCDFLYSCPGCLACDDICEVIPCFEPHTHNFDIIRLMRHEAVKRGLVSNQKIRGILKQNQDYEETALSNEDNPLSLPEKIYEKDSKQVLFVEWGLLKSDKNMYQSVLRIFQKMGKTISVISDRGVNFPELYDLGFWKEIKKYLTTKFDLRELEGKELIFLNPHLQEFFVHRCPEIVSSYKNIKIEVRHISEALLNALKKGELKDKKGGRKVKVSYHDPCYLGRGLRVYDPPRELLRLTKGVELIEMERIRGDSFCCGARAGDSYFPNLSRKTALKRLDEFKKTKADLLITACPHCRTIFQKVLDKKERSKVKDLTEFVEERVE